MAEKRILSDIIEDFRKFEGGDSEKIKDLLERTHQKLVMIVERKFGKDRDYLNQLEKIQTSHLESSSILAILPQSQIKKRIKDNLIKKGKRYLNLIDVILAELEIEKAEESNEQIEKQEIKLKDETVEDRLIRILNRFHRFSKQLEKRQGRSTIPTIEVQNEYDVQDLLHALLKLEFDDVRAEEYTPSYGGSNSRMDFLLKKEEIVVEVKKTSEKLKDKEIGVQLNDDIAKYKTHPNCKILYCFIYDPQELISNPDGLQNDLSQEKEGFKVKVIITPKR